MRIIVCHEEDCGQVARPEYTRCWHHWMEYEALHPNHMPTLHGLITQLWEYEMERDYGPGSVSAEAFTSCRKELCGCDGSKGEREDHQYYDLDELLRDIPDADKAFYVLGADYNYYINDPSREYGETVVATLWLELYEDEESEEGEAL